MVAILVITYIFIFLSGSPIDVVRLLVVKIAGIFSSGKQLAIAAEVVSRGFVRARSHECGRLFLEQLLLLRCQRGVIVV